MDITRDQQLALDDALVAPANRLKIGKSNLRLSSDLNSKEATLQVVYDVMKLTPFYKAFQITVDIPKIYMQEFWAIAIVHHHSIRFKMNNKKHIMNLDGEIKVITDVNVNKLQQPWKKFDANVDYAYLLWEDFVYQVDNKNVKRSNEMYYPRFTKVIVNFFMSKDQSIPRRNKLHGAILPNELTNESIKDSESYKEYYTIASGVEPPKTKASVKKKQARSDKAPKAPKEVALTEEEQMRIVTKRSLTQFHSSHANGSGANEGTGVTPGVPDVSKYGSDDEKISWKSSSYEDDDAENENDDDDDDADNQNDDGQEYDVQDDEDQDDDNEKTDSDNDGDDFVHPKFSTHDEEDKEEDSFDPRVQTCSHVESTDDEDNDEENVPVTTIAEPPLLSATILPPPPTPLITHLQQTPVPTPATVPRSSLQDLPNFAVSSIPGVIDAYLGNKMHEAIKTNVQLNKLDNNIKKIIKEQVKEQVKTQVSKILPKIKKTVNEHLKAEVLTRSSTESKTSHAVAANLSELELKKILIDKMESNKSIHRSNEQKNLYKALVDAYESDKLILDTYGDTFSFKRRRDDEDKDEEPSAGSNRGSKRRRARKEPESVSAPKEKTSKIIGKSTEGSKSHHESVDKSVQAEEPIYTTEDLEEPAHQEFIIGDTKDKPDEVTSQLPHCTLAQKEDTRESFNELMDTSLDFLAFVMNRLKVDTLTPELLAGLTFELMKGSCKILVELKYFFEEVYKMWSQVPVSYDKHALWGISHWGQKRQQFYGFAANRDNDKLYKFKEGDFNRLRIQDIEDMLLLLVQGKLTNLTVEEHLAFNNKDNKNKLMRIDELHKFSDGTLNDVRTAFNDRLKGIRMKYLPYTIWRQSDRDKAGAMI
ncbi:hypothetical protein Tco_1214648 [Tanacetum coccineum]